ncbi:MAG TPA: PAS domain-containing protein [Thermoanaerobaculia bacterium]|nr:PAS domain-containing protein [Thermoanaerobaculia bacterium]
MTVQKIAVEPEQLFGEIGMLTAEELDALPFGTIQLDADGKILAYNRAEEQLSGRRRDEVVGKNFFVDVAPCTRVRRFYGAFQTGVERKLLNEVFDFTFRFPAGAREVRIRMIYSANPSPCVWIFVTPMRS